MYTQTQPCMYTQAIHTHKRTHPHTYTHHMLTSDLIISRKFTRTFIHRYTHTPACYMVDVSDVTGRWVSSMRCTYTTYTHSTVCASECYRQGWNFICHISSAHVYAHNTHDSHTHDDAIHYMHACMTNTDTNTRLSTYWHVRIHTYIHIHTHIHAHTHT